jgi:hypothetical protein
MTRAEVIDIAPRAMSPRELVLSYYALGLRPVFWPAHGDAKGPTEKGWPDTRTTIHDFHDGDRVGLLTGIEISPGKCFHDVDVDWKPGSPIAVALLPPTRFVYGRDGKRHSHFGYTLPVALPSRVYADPTDKITLIEFRGTTQTGAIGRQSMCPPSVWSKDGKREPLTFHREDRSIDHIDNAIVLPHRVALSAVGMLIAKHLGTHGFGHETRLAWAGFLLRLGVATDDLITMGESISTYCDNREVHDVRTVVECTAKRLEPGSKEVSGSRVLAKILGKDGKLIVTTIQGWLGAKVEDTEKLRGRSSATKLINLVLEGSSTELFATPTGDLYATVPIGDHRETLPLTDRTFKQWLAHAYFTSTRTGATNGALTDAITTLGGVARDSSTQHEVYTRVATFDDRVLLDLARDDHRVLTIAAGGWEVIPVPSDIRFVRRLGMLPLPIPHRADQPIASLLSQVINLPAASTDMQLLIGWLVAVLRGRKPFPILAISGEHGTAKSYACRLSRQIIDPNQADLSTPPKDPRDLMIAALNSYVIGFDNLSFLPDWLSDCLCCLSTGAGFRTRALFTDATEVIFKADRPVVINAIVDVVRRPDLLDRALPITLEPIPDADRRTETEVNATFAAVQPGILAALADAVVQVFKHPVTLTSKPRMADFATIVESAAPVFQWESGEFLQVYSARREAAVDVLLEEDPVAIALDLLREQKARETSGIPKWQGRTTDLLTAIVSLTSEHNHKQLPKSARGLTGALRRLLPGLRSRRVDVQLPDRQERSGEHRGERLITITWGDSDDAIGSHDEDPKPVHAYETPPF